MAIQGVCKACGFSPTLDYLCLRCTEKERDAAILKNGEQAKAIRNVQRALERNDNREINMGEAWALIKEAVGVVEKRLPAIGCPSCGMAFTPSKPSDLRCRECERS